MADPVVDNEAKEAIDHVKAELSEIWRALDADGDDEVTKEELQTALKRRGTAEDKRVKKLGKLYSFEQLDQDRNGKISKSEFFSMFYVESRLAQLFKVADTDANGCLSKAEVKKLIDDYPEVAVLIDRRGGKAAHYVTEQFDEDSDGMISLNEFMRKLHSNQTVVELFTELDKDGSGTISKQEVAEGLKANEALMGKFKKVGIKQVMVFEQLDLNGDGTVTLKEFMARLKNLEKNELSRRASKAMS
jgi:Ca2+-binding EF-hand superfamily protein